MKRFGISAVVGFTVVFGSFYLISFKGQAGDTLFSIHSEPGVQNSTQDLTVETKTEEQRVPSSDEHMEVKLHKAAVATPAIVSHEEKTKGEKIKFVGGKGHQPEARPENATKSGFSVQIAAIADNEAAAQKMLEDYKAKGFTGYIQSVTVNDIPYSRVRIGPVASKEEAYTLREKFRSQGIKDAIIAHE